MSMLPFLVSAQVNTDCSDAVQLAMHNGCYYEEFTSTSSTMWFKFLATAENASVALITEKYGLDRPHIHNITLYHSDCATYMTETELPFADSTNALRVDIIAMGLQIGEIYYLKADRIPHTGSCNKAQCTVNQSMDSATFQICVRSLDITMPPQLSAETPAQMYAYEENRGQLADMDGNPVPEIKMFSRNSVPGVYISDEYTSFVWSKIDTIAATVDTVHRVDMKLLKALPSSMMKTEQVPGYNNYYLGHTPDGILANKSFARLMWNEVYPQIDMHHYSNKDGVKFYFLVKTGGDASNIKVGFEGATTTAITSSGGLLISSALGNLEFNKAEIFALDYAGNGMPLLNSGSFIAIGPDEYALDIESYPANMNLIIKVERTPVAASMGGAPGDPVWSTYFGGAGEETATDITADAAGNIYVVGSTSSNTQFPIWGGGIYSSAFSGAMDAYVASFNTLYERKWVTFYGGNDIDNGTGVAHDNLNNVTYVSGISSSTNNTFETRALSSNPGSYVDAVDGPDRSFFARFSNVGDLEWATFFPGLYPGTRIATDNAGNLYGIGAIPEHYAYTGTYSNTPLPGGELPVCYETPDSYRQFMNGGDAWHAQDVFVVKFNSQTELVWSTYFGGSEEEYPSDITVDANNGYVYITGSTKSAPSTLSCAALNNTSGFPLCSAGGYFQNSFTGSTREGFIARFDLQGKLDWSTYFGGNDYDMITGIATDTDGNVVITGFTHTNTYGNTPCGTSTNGGFPVCHPASSYTQAAFGGGESDAFIAFFRKTTPLTWSTYIGGAGNEDQYSQFGGPKVHINNNNQIFISGNTESGSNNATGSFPTASNPLYYFKNTHADYLAAGNAVKDNFVMSFNTSKQRTMSTYFGGRSLYTGSGETTGGIVTVGNRVYICGTTLSASHLPLNKPATGNPFYQGQLNSTDAFVAQIQVEGAETGIEELLSETGNTAETGILAYPNPNSGVFTVVWQAQTNNPAQIQVLNQLGQAVKTINTQSMPGQNTHDMHLPSLANGIYFVRIIDGTEIQTCKIIKK